MAKKWTGDELLELVRGFQPACAIVAGAELNIFTVLDGRRLTAHDLAAHLQADVRAMVMLLDALTALELLQKSGFRYSLAPGVADLLARGEGDSVLAMTRHMGNCLRHWAQLAEVVKTGRKAERKPSIRGAAEDLAAFIEAMDDVSRKAAPALVQIIGPPEFTHLLDLGGGPGTWTIALLRAQPNAQATLLDLPDVIPIARAHVQAAGLAGRVTFAPGDMSGDQPLPAGADLAWVSAIVHMNSREENRSLFRKVYAALAGGGRIMIRDVVMDTLHVSPPQGALFAINMLVNTPGGGTYTFKELSEDLKTAGFTKTRLHHAGRGMDSVIEATKPAEG
jgi:SAM-dependent methyltransferase